MKHAALSEMPRRRSSRGCRYAIRGLDPAAALYIVGNAIPLPPDVEPFRFGHTAAAGDFDGDGFDDLAVGHRATVEEIAGAGVVHVFYGSPSSLASSLSSVDARSLTFAGTCTFTSTS